MSISDVSPDDLAVLYDTATNSMDWGSGFLDNAEVAAIRRVATAMGYADVDYQLDVCTCGHAYTGHMSYGDPRKCMADSSYVEWRNLGDAYEFPCPCPGYKRRTDSTA